jgi:hypothetical protein
MGTHEWIQAFLGWQAECAGSAGPVATCGRNANMFDAATCEWIWNSLGAPGFGHGPTGQLKKDVVLAMSRAREVSPPPSSVHGKMDKILSSKHIANIVPDVLSENDIFYAPWGGYYDMWRDAPGSSVVDMRLFAQIASGAMIDWDQQLTDVRLGEHFVGNTFGSVAEILKKMASNDYDTELTLFGASAEVAYEKWRSRWSSEWYSLSYEDWRTVCGLDAHTYAIWLHLNSLGVSPEECCTWMMLGRALHDSLDYGSDVMHGEWANTVKIATTVCERGPICGYTLPYLIREDLKARHPSGPMSDTLDRYMCAELLWHCMMPRYHMFARVAYLLLTRPPNESDPLLTLTGAQACRWRPYGHGMASAEGLIIRAAFERPAISCPDGSMVDRYSYLKPVRPGQCCAARIDAAYKLIADDCGHVHASGSSLLIDISAFTRLIFDGAMCANCAFSAGQHLQIELCRNAARICRGGILTRKNEFDWWTRVLFLENGSIFRQLTRCIDEVGALETHRENGFEDFPCWSDTRWSGMGDRISDEAAMLAVGDKSSSGRWTK